MADATELKQYMEGLVKQLPKSVYGRLETGSKVGKSWGCRYMIDDPDIDRRLGDHPDGAVPFVAIYNSLRNSKEEIHVLFKGSKEIPFSRAFEAGIGECLEKAVLVQLAAQRGRDSFLLNASIELDNDIEVGSHAYNVVFKDGKPFLVDVQNPLAVSASGKITPYIAPIIELEETGHGNFVVPQEWRKGRTYSVI